MAGQKQVTTHPKVFLSFPLGDSDLAAEVSRTLSAAGIEVTTFAGIDDRESYSDEVRSGLRQSDAVVVVLSTIAQRREIPASVLFEIGAATGANKPIFVIVQSMDQKLPFNVPGMH